MRGKECFELMLPAETISATATPRTTHSQGGEVVEKRKTGNMTKQSLWAVETEGAVSKHLVDLARQRMAKTEG